MKIFHAELHFFSEIRKYFLNALKTYISITRKNNSTRDSRDMVQLPLLAFSPI